MLDWSKKLNNYQALCVETSNIEELRAQRVWRYIVVLWMTWGFFAGYLWLRGYDLAATICIAESVLHLVILIACYHEKRYQLIMNLNLAASAVGLVLVSLSHPTMAPTMMFYPVSILVASQLLGVRPAFIWFMITLAAFSLFFVAAYGLEATLTAPKLDQFVLAAGVAGCIFFCCYQGEAYYRERTKGLFDLMQDLRRKGEELRKLATTDALTGLMNRFHFQVRLREATSRAIESGERLALFLIDMDGFKEINDTLGHPVGDAALVEISSRLKQQFGEVADVARLGGDEFCVIWPNVGEALDAMSVACRISQFLTQRYELEEAEFLLGGSVGVALCPDHTTSDDDLLAYADTAMFHAKEQRLGYACYEPSMTDRLVEYRTTQERLAHALDRNEFFLVYQPQVDLESGNVVGVEALLRWKHNGEVIPPYRFIHLLEQSHEIIRVSKWIVQECCRQLSEWQREGYDTKISINVSAVQFADPDFYSSIAASITRFGIDAKNLDFEITEGLLIDDVAEAAEKLMQLKKLGASISVDDFGTGHSSLAYLRQFPLDRLKIDRAFIKDIPDGDDGVIASSIIVLGKALGLSVLAEGVETEAHLEFLKAHDCDEYQGYYLSPPVTAAEVVRFFTRRTTCGASESELSSEAPGTAPPIATESIA